MAHVILSSLISDIRGRIGGSVFQKTSSGLILKSYTKPINKNSQSQNITRNYLAYLQNQWLLLSDSQRIIWSRFLTYNPIKQKNISGHFITGHQAFLKLNFYRLLYNISILLTPRFTKCNITPVDLTLSLIGPDLTLTSDRSMISSDEFIILFLSPPTLRPVNNPGNSFKIIKFDTTNTDTFNLSSAYLSLYGRLPVATNKVFMKFSTANKFSGILFPFVQKVFTL